jgi:hypothetical protein
MVQGVYVPPAAGPSVWVARTRFNRRGGRSKTHGLNRFTVCRICGCTDDLPCAGGCGWTKVADGELPLCLACADFSKDLEAFVEDGRVPKAGMLRLYREVRRRIDDRLAEEEGEVSAALTREQRARTAGAA